MSAGRRLAWCAAHAEHEGRVAAVLTEPVQGAGGVFPPPDGDLEAVRRLCDQHGAYLIMDEEMFGDARLQDWLASSPASSMQSLCTDLAETIRQYEAGRQSDDVTVLAFSRSR